MNNKYLFTSESVSQGHPDKVADIISDRLLDEYLSYDKKSRTGIETFVAGNNIIVGGEIKSKLKLSKNKIKKIIIETLKDIGYYENYNFTDTEVIKPSKVKIQVLLNEQSPDISIGVDKEGIIGAGDQGIMFGYACNESENFMPLTIEYAKQLQTKVYEFAKNNKNYGIDIKTQITIDYETKDNFENCIPKNIDTIIVSVPCVSSYSLEEVKLDILNIIFNSGIFNEKLLTNKTKILINPTGRYVNHSPLHDSGLTGRKLIVDTFGGHSPIGGGAQSGKDYSKVDRSGLYISRFIAKHIVAAGLSKKCSVQLSYSIGISEPISVNVDTYGTHLDFLNDDIISNFIKSNFVFTPKYINNLFGLEDKVKYITTAKNGQVGNEKLPWEDLKFIDMFKCLKKDFKIYIK